LSLVQCQSRLSGLTAQHAFASDKGLIGPIGPGKLNELGVTVTVILRSAWEAEAVVGESFGKVVAVAVTNVLREALVAGHLGNHERRWRELDHLLVTGNTRLRMNKPLR